MPKSLVSVTRNGSPVVRPKHMQRNPGPDPIAFTNDFSSCVCTELFEGILTHGYQLVLTIYGSRYW